MAFLEEQVSPFVILGLGNLVFGTELGDFDLSAKAFKYDLGLLLVCPLAFFHENRLLWLELNSTQFGQFC